LLVKHKPILYKRNFGAGIEEFLSFAEYMVAEENRDIILCERGILPLGKGKSYTRYTLDLAAVPVIQKETYLPVIVDPSHAAGRRDLVASLSYAAIAAGACDSQQQITPSELKDIITNSRKIHEAVSTRKNGG
jgi:3-deoxy-7-phosphoheptulonate synthase